MIDEVIWKFVSSQESVEKLREQLTVGEELVCRSEVSSFLGGLFQGFQE